MLKNWLKIFLYQIKDNKIFTALNILGLSMGIAGLIFAILYWNDEHSYKNVHHSNREWQKSTLQFPYSTPGYLEL